MIAMAFYGIYLGLDEWMPLGEPKSAAAITRNVLAGHWGFFQMGAIVLAGVAVGLILDARLRVGQSLRTFLPHGLLMIAGALLMSAAAGDMASWVTFPKPITLWAVVFYSGLALTIFATFETLTRIVARTALLRGLIHWICCAGILLFPLYVAQSLVYHGSVILGHYTGLSPVKTLTVVILAFFALVAHPLWRVHKLYYAGRK